jgi:hypothetical protein
LAGLLVSGELNGDVLKRGSVSRIPRSQALELSLNGGVNAVSCAGDFDG